MTLYAYCILCQITGFRSPFLSHKLLFENLLPVEANWYTVGLCLNIDPRSLDAIEVEHSKNCRRCLSKVLDIWTTVKPDAKWEDVVEMLISPALKEIALAKIIKQKFEV